MVREGRGHEDRGLEKCHSPFPLNFPSLPKYSCSFRNCLLVVKVSEAKPDEFKKALKT
jgi:hypothetical protein